MKTKRYWLRGLITGFLIGLLSMAIYVVSYFNCFLDFMNFTPSWQCRNPASTIFLILGFPFHITQTGLDLGGINLISLLGVFILFSIVGILCGLLYGKIKNDLPRNT